MQNTSPIKKKKEIKYTVRTARSVMNELAQSIKERKGSPDLPTGIPSLDELTWGVHKSEVQIIAARTSVGKTSMALQWAIHLSLQKKNVLFISLEMTNDQVMERALCSHCGISGWDLRRGIIPSDFDEKVSQFKKVTDHLDLFLVDDMGASFAHVRSIFNSMNQQQTKPDVIFIDYINLISSEEGQDERVAIKNYLGELQEFAKVYGVAVVVVAQINRGAEQKKNSKPSLHDLKGSGALEEVPSTICILHWQRNDLDPEASGEFQVIVAKARHGPQGVVNLKFNAEHYRFEDVPIPVERNDKQEVWHGINGAEPVERDFTQPKTAKEEDFP